MNVVRSCVVFGSVAILLAGCGAAIVPSSQIASTEAAMRAAREGGAANTPSAALHLHYAELEKAEAQRLATDGNGDSAVLQFRRAEADANLALALSREADALHTAQAASDSLRTTETPAR